VLKRVDPRYSIRISGMIVGLTGLLVFWTIGARMLIRQETALSKEELRRYRREVEQRRRKHTGKILRDAVLKYLRPSFHPDQHDNYHLAAQYLGSLA
jgi:predicted metal-dependent hydrolase